eukprot:2022100-Alexandrium_andersonii.AAC.1
MACLKAPIQVTIFWRWYWLIMSAIAPYFSIQELAGCSITTKAPRCMATTRSTTVFSLSSSPA